MKAEEILANTQDAITVRRVFAEPVERDGTTVISAAAVGGGGGAGGSTGEEGEGSGSGFGIGGKPVGALVIRDGKVHWQPAVDVNRLMVVVGAVAIAALLAGVRMAGRGCAHAG
ncbi:spore germination protein GerW family protein [Nocardia jiangsuensis]|uniref:Spore germination protein GerW family protein n=1 Tax=Nocardia jiangsuensis TaxID=1691563 RepID=A0ABV8DND5_9NOCA